MSRLALPLQAAVGLAASSSAARPVPLPSTPDVPALVRARLRRRRCRLCFLTPCVRGAVSLSMTGVVCSADAAPIRRRRHNLSHAPMRAQPVPRRCRMATGSAGSAPRSAARSRQRACRPSGLRATPSLTSCWHQTRCARSTTAPGAAVVVRVHAFVHAHAHACMQAQDMRMAARVHASPCVLEWLVER
jgi:hypothetical protein